MHAWNFLLSLTRWYRWSFFGVTVAEQSSCSRVEEIFHVDLLNQLLCVAVFSCVRLQRGGERKMRLIGDSVWWRYIKMKMNWLLSMQNEKKDVSFVCFGCDVVECLASMQCCWRSELLFVFILLLLRLRFYSTLSEIDSGISTRQREEEGIKAEIRYDHWIRVDYESELAVETSGPSRKYV